MKIGRQKVYQKNNGGRSIYIYEFQFRCELNRAHSLFLFRGTLRDFPTGLLLKDFRGYPSGPFKS